MNTNFRIVGTMMVLASIISLGSCKKDDDQPEFPQPVVNEPEEITTVELHFTNEATSAEFHVSWSDPDGPGGNAPIIDDIVLDSGTTYTVSVRFLDESGATAEDITAEIMEEDDEHIICIEPEGDLTSALEINRTDSDGTFEVGLMSSWNTLAISSGDLHLILKHQPDGQKDGTCAPGDTDVEIHFNVTIN